jgi:hypothetical protein
MFGGLYLRLADCKHRTFLGRPTLVRCVTATQTEYTRCAKCRMVWLQPLDQSLYEWRHGLLRDNFATHRAH